MSRAVMTHFLAIPLSTASSATRLNASLAQFAAEVTAEPSPFNQPTTASTSTADKSNNSTIPASLTSFMDAISIAGQGNSSNSGSPESPGVAENSHNGKTCQSIAQSTGMDPSSAKKARHHSAEDWTVSFPLPKEALRPPASIHLTLGVMSLPTSEKLESAASFLSALNLNAFLDAAMIQTNNNKAKTHNKSRQKAKASSKAQAAASREETNAIVSQETTTTTTTGYHAHAPLDISIRGLHPMQVPEATSVLYAAPHDPTERLQPFCEALQKTFMEAGHVLNENRPLKLHASIVNTLQAKSVLKKRHGHVEARAGGGEGADRVSFGERGEHARQPVSSRKNRNQSFRLDARKLMERWKDEVWTELRVEKLVICELGVKMDHDGVLRYREVAQLDMPYMGLDRSLA
ncbi:hypothetical protein EDD11_006439 [Mortierella claussenii]|nr:hypothetical protein EDD11_006439 [Mortierella claussenii]